MATKRKGFDFDEILEEISKRKLSKAAILSQVNLEDYERVKNIVKNGATFSQEQWKEMVDKKEISEEISIAIILSEHSPVEVKMCAFEKTKNRKTEYINFLIIREVDKQFFKAILPIVFSKKTTKKEANTPCYSYNFIVAAFDYAKEGNYVDNNCLAAIFQRIDDEASLNKMFSVIPEKTLSILEGILKNEKLSNTFKKYAFFETAKNINIAQLYSTFYKIVTPEIAEEFDKYADEYIDYGRPEYAKDRVMSETFYLASDEKKISAIQKFNMHVLESKNGYLIPYEVDKFCDLIESFKTSEGLDALIDLITPNQICGVLREYGERVFEHDCPILSAFIANPHLTSKQALKLWVAYNEPHFFSRVYYYRAYEYNLISKALPQLKELDDWKDILSTFIHNAHNRYSAMHYSYSVYCDSFKEQMLFVDALLQSDAYTREEKEELLFKQEHLVVSDAIVYASIYLRLLDAGYLTNNILKMLQSCYVFHVWGEDRKAIQDALSTEEKDIIYKEIKNSERNLAKRAKYRVHFFPRYFNDLLEEMKYNIYPYEEKENKWFRPCRKSFRGTANVYEFYEKMLGYEKIANSEDEFEIC